MRASLDLILPCYDPPSGWERRVARCIRGIRRRLPDTGLVTYIVNDGSAIGFEPQVRDYLRRAVPDAHVIEYGKNMGKGYALRQAVVQCRSEFVVYTDCDFPYTEESFLKVVSSLRSGADVAVAVRGKEYREKLPPSRKMFTRLSRFSNRHFLRLEMIDTQGGLKGFNGEGLKVFLTTRIKSYLFDTELFIFQNAKVSVSKQ